MRSLTRIHHAGIACRDISATRDWVYLTHDVTGDSGVIWDPEQNADLCLLEVPGGAIELVSGPVVAGLLNRGPTVYHLCYEVEAIAGAIAELQQNECRLVSAPTPAVLFGGRQVAFLLGPTGLLELLERPCES